MRQIMKVKQWKEQQELNLEIERLLEEYSVKIEDITFAISPRQMVWDEVNLIMYDKPIHVKGHHFTNFNQLFI